MEGKKGWVGEEKDPQIPVPQRRITCQHVCACVWQHKWPWSSTSRQNPGSAEWLGSRVRVQLTRCAFRRFCCVKKCCFWLKPLKRDAGHCFLKCCFCDLLKGLHKREPTHCCGCCCFQITVLLRCSTSSVDLPRFASSISVQTGRSATPHPTISPPPQVAVTELLLMSK